jgi:hypothetical protein
MEELERRRRSRLPKPQELAQACAHPKQFLIGQCSDAMIEADNWDGEKLLEMKRSRLEERLGEREFPSSAAQGRGVRHHRDQHEFVALRVCQ